MSDLAIRVENLSNLYPIGARSDPHGTPPGRMARTLVALPPYRKGIVLAVLISGAAYLNRTEETFAEVV